MKTINRILNWYYLLIIVTGFLFSSAYGIQSTGIMESQELVEKSQHLISENVDDYWVINSKTQNRTNTASELIIKKDQQLENHLADIKFSISSINNTDVVGVDTFVSDGTTKIRNLIVKEITNLGVILTQLRNNENLLTIQSKIYLKGQFINLESFYWENAYHYYISVLNNTANNENQHLTLYWNPTTNQSIYLDGYLHDYYILENPIILLSNYPNEDSYKSSYLDKKMKIVQIYNYQNRSYSNVLFVETFDSAIDIKLLSIIELTNYILLFSSKLIHDVRQLDMTTFRRSATHLVNITTWVTNSEFNLNVGKVIYLEDEVGQTHSETDESIHLVVLGDLERYYLQNNNTIKLRYSLMFTLEISMEDFVFITSNYLADIPYENVYIAVLRYDGKHHYEVLTEKITYDDNGTALTSIYLVELVPKEKVESRIIEFLVVGLVFVINITILSYIINNRSKLSNLLLKRFNRS